MIDLGSRTSLNKLEKELSNLKETEDDHGPKFPQVSVIVEPPSPDLNEQIRLERAEKINVEIEIECDYDLHHLVSKTDHLSTSDVTSNNSSNSNLLSKLPFRFSHLACCLTHSTGIATVVNLPRHHWDSLVSLCRLD